jgi:uncharacterized protein (DUF305 family)
MSSLPKTDFGTSQTWIEMSQMQQNFSQRMLPHHQGMSASFRVRVLGPMLSIFTDVILWHRKFL